MTRAMELSPSNPSYLDMRNSILEADMVDNGGSLHDTIWTVFAHRGMGFFAAAVDGDDLAPVEDFSMPPDGKPTGRIQGTVTDVDSGAGIQGIIVQFGGHNSGFTGTLAAITDENGRYEIRNIFPGTYPKVAASGAGFDPQVQSVTVLGRDDEDEDQGDHSGKGKGGDNHGKGKGDDNRGRGKHDDKNKQADVNFQLRRDWAALSGGGSIFDFNGPDFTGFGCGPSSAIDQSETNGWGSTTDGDDGTSTGKVTPKFIVVQLPRGSERQRDHGQPVEHLRRRRERRNTRLADRGVERRHDVHANSDRACSTRQPREGEHGLHRNVRERQVRQVLDAQPAGADGPDGNGDCDCTGRPTAAPTPTTTPASRCTARRRRSDFPSGCQFMDMDEIKVFGVRHRRPVFGSTMRKGPPFGAALSISGTG